MRTSADMRRALVFLAFLGAISATTLSGCNEAAEDGDAAIDRHIRWAERPAGAAAEPGGVDADFAEGQPRVHDDNGASGGL